MYHNMMNRKKLVKDALSLFVTLSITAISTGASNALPLKENTQKGANAVSSSSDNKQVQPTSYPCYYDIPDSQGNYKCRKRPCSEVNDHYYYRC